VTTFFAIVIACVVVICAAVPFLQAWLRERSEKRMREWEKRDSQPLIATKREKRK
jgi:hypothetical protein